MICFYDAPFVFKDIVLFNAEQVVQNCKAVKCIDISQAQYILYYISCIEQLDKRIKLEMYL